MIKRDLAKHVKRLAQDYGVVTLIGPRQSGKTTLCRMVFPNYAYVSLENLDDRQRIKIDPKQFLEDHQEGVIIDEIQHFPELLSYIQGIVDRRSKKGL